VFTVEFSYLFDTIQFFNTSPKSQGPSPTSKNCCHVGTPCHIWDSRLGTLCEVVSPNFHALNIEIARIEFKWLGIEDFGTPCELILNLGYFPNLTYIYVCVCVCVCEREREREREREAWDRYIVSLQNAHIVEFVCEERQNHGFNPSRIENLLIARWLVVYQSLFLKLDEIFGTSRLGTSSRFHLIYFTKKP
jgi:hypothetical protein